MRDILTAAEANREHEVARLGDPDAEITAPVEGLRS